MSRRRWQLGLIVLVLITASLLWTEQQRRPAAPAKTEPVSLVLNGDLGAKYFSASELAGLGLADQIDPTQVAYWRGLVLTELTPGCQVKDCIVSIDRPEFEPVAPADGWLSERDLVISVEQGQLARAYPLKILNYHEVVNDWLAGRPIVVSYCPLCRSALVFVRPEYQGSPLQMGVAGRLYKSNLILYDRQTGTFWSQLTARPIIGPLVSSELRLRQLRSDILPWASWKAAHPDGQVLARPTERTAVGGQPPSPTKRAPRGVLRSRGSLSYLYDYSHDPYAEYAAGPAASTASPEARLAPQALIIGVQLDKLSKAYPQSLLAQPGQISDRLGTSELLIQRDRQGRIQVWQRTAEGKLRPLAQVSAYWFAWLAFHPDTELYRPPG